MRSNSPDEPAERWTVSGLLRDPARLFVLVATLVGVCIAFAMPAFAGSDEPGHFARTYRLAEGQVVADDAVPGAHGVGACLPGPVLRDMSRLLATALYGSSAGNAAPDAEVDRLYPRCGEPGEGRGFVDTATFAWYSPLAYLPAATAVALTSSLHVPVGGQLVVARLANLAAYVALVWLGIRRAPAGRWALASVALLPVALFSAASLSPDAITTALVIVVISSAWRAYARPEVVGTWAFLLESIGLSVALGLAKPTYVVFALAYGLPLLVRRRRSSWTLALPVVIGGGLSTLWYRSQQDRFTCDVWMFGIDPDPARQTDAILHGPHQFAGAAARAVLDHGGGWLSESFAFADRVAPAFTGPFVVAMGVAAFVLAGLQRAPSERFVPAWPSRVGLVALAVVGYLAVLAGWLVYCSAPELTVVDAPHARILLPVLPAAVVGLAPAGRWARRLAELRVPPGLLLVLVDLAFVLDLAVTNR